MALGDGWVSWSTTARAVGNAVSRLRAKVAPPVRSDVLHISCGMRGYSDSSGTVSSLPPTKSSDPLNSVAGTHLSTISCSSNRFSRSEKIT